MENIEYSPSKEFYCKGENLDIKSKKTAIYINWSILVTIDYSVCE